MLYLAHREYREVVGVSRNHLQEFMGAAPALPCTMGAASLEPTLERAHASSLLAASFPTEEGASGAVMVFYCCLTDYHKLSGVKHHPLSSSQFCRAGVCGRRDCVPCSGTRKVGIKVSAGPSSHLGAKEKDSFPSSFLLAESDSSRWED